MRARFSISTAIDWCHLPFAVFCSERLQLFQFSNVKRWRLVKQPSPIASQRQWKIDIFKQLSIRLFGSEIQPSLALFFRFRERKKKTNKQSFSGVCICLFTKSKKKKSSSLIYEHFNSSSAWFLVKQKWLVQKHFSSHNGKTCLKIMCKIWISFQIQFSANCPSTKVDVWAFRWEIGSVFTKEVLRFPSTRKKSATIVSNNKHGTTHNKSDHRN